jgi:hypothetical protein
MKKMILATMIILGFTGVANASTVQTLEIKNCGNSAATIFTRVTSAGWYYLISPDDSSLEDWYYLTPIYNRSFNVKNTDTRSTVLLIDNSTYTATRGKCN